MRMLHLRVVKVTLVQTTKRVAVRNLGLHLTLPQESEEDVDDLLWDVDIPVYTHHTNRQQCTLCTQ